MDALLSPRRRTLLQALGAAALVSGCGDWRGAAVAPALEFRGPTMGSSYTVKIAGARLTRGKSVRPRFAMRRTARWTRSKRR